MTSSPEPRPARRDRREPPAGRRALAAWRVLAALALLAQAIALYVPTAPDTSGTPLPPWFDLVVHVGVFAAATAATMAAFPGAPRLVLALNVLHAPVSELVQHWFLPHRTGDVRDLVADLVGVALGALVAWAVARRPRPGWVPGTPDRSSTR